jgi:hypothetical protein
MLAQLLARDDRVPACMMQHLYRYATGWSEEPRDRDRVNALTASFRASGYRLYDAILTLVTSEAFTSVR